MTQTGEQLVRGTMDVCTCCRGGECMYVWAVDSMWQYIVIVIITQLACAVSAVSAARYKAEFN